MQRVVYAAKQLARQQANIAIQGTVGVHPYPRVLWTTERVRTLVTSNATVDWIPKYATVVKNTATHQKLFVQPPICSTDRLQSAKIRQERVRISLLRSVGVVWQSARVLQVCIVLKLLTDAVRHQYAPTQWVTPSTLYLACVAKRTAMKEMV